MNGPVHVGKEDKQVKQHYKYDDYHRGGEPEREAPDLAICHKICTKQDLSRVHTSRYLRKLLCGYTCITALSCRGVDNF